jgi:hypothetical protein
MLSFRKHTTEYVAYVSTASATPKSAVEMHNLRPPVDLVNHNHVLTRSTDKC